ncbi:TetR/AcrR family transcriptional regulator [Acinetobacter proteolyticus]|uniref:TetR/AcrR family transcriptional regulator n=1 Tax=Acinetobacter proteolyticus TaxID=1776741 RepID=UPI0031E0F2F9
MQKKSPGRPSTVRPNIVQAARELFLEYGLDVSLDTIAIKAGTTRQTLYNHFPTKTVLLLEIFENFKVEMETPFFNKKDLNVINKFDQLLLEIGQTVQNHFYDKNVIRLQRLMIIALVEMPEILDQVQQRTQGSIKKSLMQILEKAHNAEIIKINNSEEAAKAFLGAVMGYSYPAALLGGPLPNTQELKKLNEEVCQTFLNAWGYKINILHSHGRNQ